MSCNREIPLIAIFIRLKFRFDAISLITWKFNFGTFHAYENPVGRRARSLTLGLMDLFFDRRRKSGGRVVRQVDVAGLGSLALVRSVDCLGAMCPRPQLLTMKVLGEVRVGDVIEVLSDNPSAVEGFPALALALNCEHLKTVRESDFWRMYIRKG